MSADERRALDAAYVEVREFAGARAQAAFAALTRALTKDASHPLAAHALKLAQDSIADGVPRDAAFMLHQAVERAYNAVLLVLTLYAPKSHRIGILRSLAENLDPRLIEAWPRDTRAARRHFAQLQRAYVEARYSHAYEITPDELAWLVDRVKHLHTIAAAICADHLENDSGRES